MNIPPNAKWFRTQTVTVTIPAKEPVRDTYDDGYLDALLDVQNLIERVMNSRDPVREGRALLFASTRISATPAKKRSGRPWWR